MKRLPYIFIIFFCGYMIPAQAFFRSFISMLYNTAQYTSARFKKTMGTETAYAWARKTAQKESSAHVPQSPKLNYAAMHKEIADDNQEFGMSAKFNVNAKIYARCKRKDTNCTDFLRLFQGQINTPRVPAPNTLNVVAMDIQEDKNDPEYVKATTKIHAAGNWKCPDNNTRCNQKLYALSKCTKDFSRCIVQESQQKPRSSRCSTLFNLFDLTFPIAGFKTNDQEITISNFDLNVTLDEPEESSSWL